MAMERLFHLMSEKGASDMFLAVGSPVHIKINGLTIPINQQRLDNTRIRSLLNEVITPERMVELENTNELNIGLPVTGVGSFRLSAFRQRGSFSAVIRYIPSDIPALSSLGVPEALSSLILEKRGLILMVGATGSGKSTSLAAMLDYRNEQMPGHILTIEDPIEYVFRNKKSIINQREIGSDAASLQIALKNALRQAPDCILIGEIRDRETMTAALAYAQSGHLCLATLHANNSYHALNRILSFYPLESRNALLADMSSSLKAIISQRLLRAKRGGRVPAAEIMINSRHVSELIEQGDINGIKAAMEKSLAPGSLTFEQSLAQLIRDEMVSQEEALAHSDSPTNLLWVLENNFVASAHLPPEPVIEETPTGPSFSEFTLEM